MTQNAARWRRKEGNIRTEHRSTLIAALELPDQAFTIGIGVGRQGGTQRSKIPGGRGGCGGPDGAGGGVTGSLAEPCLKKCSGGLGASIQIRQRDETIALGRVRMFGTNKAEPFPLGSLAFCPGKPGQFWTPVTRRCQDGQGISLRELSGNRQARQR